ncbi:MAG: sulfatase-like hydrolase/transferase, partial [Thermoguttaceae bacterium]
MFEPKDSDAQNDARAERTARRWGRLAIVFLLAAVVVTVVNRSRRDQEVDSVKRQQVLPDLQPAPRIALEPAALKDWNVLLISLDTTRANHLNTYGYQYTKTPVLNRLARGGALFSHAYTPSPATMPAHSSLHTGLYPLNHGVRANGTFRLGDENVTLAETLRDAGYRTGASISAFVLDSRFGIDQGFETFDDDLTVGMKHSPNMFRERAAELTNVPVTKWLRENGNERFFYWVHYFDPHAPYAPPEPFRTQYAGGPYDGEIDYADQQIGKLLDVLDEIGVRDRTLVIVVSDHGEGLGQHGEETHSLLIYDSTLHVPMIFSAPPPFPQGKVIHDQVCLIDVMPTVLDLLGMAVPENLDGLSLLQEVSSVRTNINIETLATMTLHGWAPLIGIRSEEHKFVLAPQKEVYDLRGDPLEESNLHDSRPDLARRLYQELIDMVGSEDPYMATAVGQDLTMDDETRRRLESLGYIATASAEDVAPEALPDPKEMVYHWERLQRGIHLKLIGRVHEALEILVEAVEKVPRDIYARQNLSSCYSLMGDIDKAIETLQPALEYRKDDSGLIVTMAGLHFGKLQIKKAEQLYQQVLESEPENTEAMSGLARIEYIRGDAEKAIETLEKIIEINPGTAGPSAFNQIGMIHLRAGRSDEAREAYKSALEIDGLNGRAHDGLANVLLAEGKQDEAMGHLQLALRYNPL